jgi:hypothetical protein
MSVTAPFSVTRIEVPVYETTTTSFPAVPSMSRLLLGDDGRHQSVAERLERGAEPDDP